MSLPGADELFRATGGMALSPSLARSGEGRAETARTTEAARAGESAGATDADRARPAVHGNPVNGTGANGAQVHGGAANGTAIGARQADGQQPGQGPARGAAPAEEAGETARRRPRARGPRRPTGRERHDEKITVYVSAEELMDLEHARLVLRGEHGLAVDRGRVVREAISVVLADLEQRGEASILVRRLRGR
ncbi:hypothetical protein [Kitasatospora paracochleata]|uniref:Uncharacterized protein n=2 Tax=Kitasatospora TaxID=2063 RepID=A0ABT1IT02_9ACTN|nr:hypothetical protein [Kitasatospora paracochleata]MCP2308209.1 hypothetical protein [Kitasatospora paracochleata]